MNGISIIVPCRNGATYLAATLRSVINQTLPPLEIIVIDDGSTDNSRDIAESFGHIVKVHAGAAKGAAVARNTGAGLAAGDRLMFLDADDLLTPRTLEALSAELDKQCREDEAFSICRWDRLVRSGDQALAPWLVHPPTNELPLPGQDPLANWLTGTWSPPCCVLWSRAGFAASGGWLQAAGLDDDGNLARRALAKGVRRIFSSGGLALYRRLPSEATSYSGRRLEPFGLRSRIASLADTIEALEETGAVSRYRAPLCVSLGELRNDSQVHPEFLPEIDALIVRAGGMRDRDRRWLEVKRFSAMAIAWADEKKVSATPWAPTGYQSAIEVIDSADDHALVSVVVPTYNRAAVTERAVASVLLQDYENFEIIVVIDGSTDDTVERLRNIGDSRIRVIEQENRGASYARNRGVEAARGEFIAFLDSDDEWLPGKLRPQVAALQIAPARVALCCTAMDLQDASGRSTIKYSQVGSGNCFERMLVENIVQGLTSCLVRREVFDSVGGFDPALPAIEDWEWLQRVSRLYDLIALEDVLVVYHDEAADARVSRDLSKNMEGRAILWERNRHALRRAGLAHEYAHESARRELREAVGNITRGRRLVLQMLFERPLDWRKWSWLPYMLAPAPLRAWLRRVDRRSIT